MLLKGEELFVFGFDSAFKAMKVLDFEREDWGEEEQKWPEREFLGNHAVMTCAEFLDDRFLLVGGDDRLVKVWDVDKRLWVDELRGHENTVTWLLVTEEHVFSGSMDHNVIQWSREDLL